MMKRYLLLLATGAFLLLTLAACNGKSSEADFRSALDTERGISLSLGISQADLEQALGATLEESPAMEGYYSYPASEDGASASLLFVDDMLQEVITQSPAIQLQGGFGVGSQISQLGEDWSLVRVSDSADAAFRYFNADGKLLLDTTEAVVMQILTFYDGSETAGEAALYTLN